MHGLAGVHVEDVADAVAERERVRRQLRAKKKKEKCMLCARALEAGTVKVADARLVELVGHSRSQLRAERLPLDREQTVPLKVPERPVVGDDLEAVGQRLEAAPGTVAAIVALADELGEHCRALVRWQVVDRGARLVLGDRRRLEQQPSEQLLLAALNGEQPHGGPGLVLAAAGTVERQPRGP